MADPSDDWLSSFTVEQIEACFRALMFRDIARAKRIYEAIAGTINDPVLVALASAPIEDELDQEEMKREIAEALEASETAERVSAEDAWREILE